jgi:AcrR family transcriptional regulator
MATPEPASIWRRPEPGARRAAYTREQIAKTAIAIADAEGFGAVSMRRVAAELGAGTMTLYHYVRSKDELIALIDDAIMGELLIPEDELPSDWREAMAEIARRTRDAFLRHPWSFDIPQGGEGGPNGTKHFEQSLAAVAGTGLDQPEQLEVVSLVDDYVFGFALRTNAIRATAGPDPAELADQWAEAIADLIEALPADEFPHVTGFFAGRDPREVLTDLFESVLGEGRFERGLELLLDGIERRIERSRDR